MAKRGSVFIALSIIVLYFLLACCGQPTLRPAPLAPNQHQHQLEPSSQPQQLQAVNSRLSSGGTGVSMTLSNLIYCEVVAGFEVDACCYTIEPRMSDCLMRVEPM